MRSILVSLGLIVATCPGWGQTINQFPLLAGSRPAVYGGTSGDLLASGANPASLARLRKAGISLYSEQPYLVPALGRSLLIAGCPVASGTLGLTWQQQGRKAYRESRVGLSYAMRLGGRLETAVQFSYNRISITGGYGAAVAVSGEVGVILHLTDRLHAGFDMNNPIGGKFAKPALEKLPSIYTAGLAWVCSDRVSLAVELQKQEYLPPDLITTLHYRVLDKLELLSGFEATTPCPWFGARIRIRSFQLQVSSGYHLVLGPTPALALVIPFSSRQNEGL